ncbi:ribonuclease HII [Caldalkalibacillus salinus]|uniref:ribonuclease HII n=1 Tax=Caldalkalibacillus salinus TaxID=2803787 RepID=UPI0019228B08|nr:ribonuclease HII [Caldalkalibacillus salinus]
MKFQNMTIKEIKSWLDNTAEEHVVQHLKALEKDGRQGVKRLAQSWERRIQLKEERERHWEHIQRHEKELREQGYNFIAGVDEVGRGPIAGPVVAAAVILPQDFKLVGINDSKQLSKEDRETYDTYIREHALDYHIAFVDAKDIDRMNIYQATVQAMKDALTTMTMKPEYALIDAVRLSHLSYPSRSIVKGDANSVSIAAASIIAKVARDRWMEEIANLYPQYGFERHKGYGTKEHWQALNEKGPTPIHRKSFIQQQMTITLGEQS